MIQKKKKLSLITLSKTQGGANIAASRISNILKKNFDLQVLHPKKNLFFSMIKYYLARLFVKFYIGKSKYLNSLNLFSRLKLSEIKGDIIHLNWIGEETISIDDLNKIKKPIFWTMHDMWPVTSTEHFLENPNQNKYLKQNTQNNFLKDKVFQKKKIFFSKKNIFIITNSKWLENFCKKSDLTRKVKVKTIYNPIKTEIWRKYEKSLSKKKLNLNPQKKYILFGAHGGLKNFRKGGDLLIDSLNNLSELKNNLEFLILGTDENYTKKINNFYFNFRKFTLSEKDQILYHSSADITVIPSRGESIPQFAVETILCENAIAAFDIGGFSEIIKHKVNGYLAKPFDTKDFSYGINICLEKIKKKELIKNRNKIIKKFNEKKIKKEYLNFIKKNSFKS